MTVEENVETMLSPVLEPEVTGQAPEDDPPAGDPPSENPPESDPPSGEPPEDDPPSGEPPLGDPPSEEPAVQEDFAAAETTMLEASQSQQVDDPDQAKRALLEAVIYITEEPLTAEQIALALGEPREEVERLLEQLVQEYASPAHGLTVREVAGGFKMGTKPEHHEAVRNFVRNLKPPLKLSLAALETLAVVAYKQPITAPEIMDIRGVQGAGVMKTLLDRKLITVAGRKNVIGKPILYKTTKEFLIQFGLKNISELPSLKEFEELRRLAFLEPEPELLPEVLPLDPEEGVPQTGNAEGDAEQVDVPEPEEETHAG